MSKICHKSKTNFNVTIKTIGFQDEQQLQCAFDRIKPSSKNKFHMNSFRAYIEGPGCICESSIFCCPFHLTLEVKYATTI